MLPGVEAARRRRVHQSSSINNSSCSSPSSRRLSFSLFSTNTSTTSASTFLGHTTRSRTSYEDVDDDEDDAKLGALAREAKVRLDAKLRSTPLKSTRNNNRIGRFLNNENEVTRKKKKKKNGKLSWNWKSGDQLELQDKNKNGECAVCLDEMKEGDDIMNLECDHSFHSKCLMPWLQTPVAGSVSNTFKLHFSHSFYVRSFITMFIGLLITIYQLVCNVNTSKIEVFQASCQPISCVLFSPTLSLFYPFLLSAHLIYVTMTEKFPINYLHRSS
ncbi:uncharacterized protein LOC110708082 isoform X2 [Chenopodium quinoa]|nr:uncharacterized protein LOC110708082 isoform X2 [Chenopodium quinoa]